MFFAIVLKFSDVEFFSFQCIRLLCPYNLWRFSVRCQNLRFLYVFNPRLSCYQGGYHHLFHRIYLKSVLDNIRNVGLMTCAIDNAHVHGKISESSVQ